VHTDYSEVQIKYRNYKQDLNKCAKDPRKRNRNAIQSSATAGRERTRTTAFDAKIGD
jgi:hypothetical protein